MSENVSNDADRYGEFREKLEELINRHSLENGSQTPDFILAEYLSGCLDVFDRAVRARAAWRREKHPILGHEWANAHDGP